MYWILALFLIACHSSDRSNPLDLRLTPPVELQATVDDSAGTTLLTWTAYDGSEPFAAYLVLRSVPGRTRVDTLAEITEAQTTAFTDSSLVANTAYEYRIAVANASGFVVDSNEQSTSGFAISPVRLIEAIVDRATGQVVVRWHRFNGPRFEAYRVERFSIDAAAFEEVTRVSAVSDTNFVDSDLTADVPYRYRIVLEAAGESWTSERSDQVRLSSSPVQLLSVDFDARQGAALLEWTEYSGNQPFAHYEIVRRIPRQGQVQRLGIVETEAVTSFVDEEVEADRLYTYTVVVATTTGIEIESDPIDVFEPIPTPELHLEFDRDAGSATMAWSRAPVGFDHYEIRRVSVAEGDVVILHSTNDIGDTTYVDLSMVDGIEYSYTVVVHSAGGTLVPSNPVVGPALPKIAFYTDRDGNWEVYTMNPDGTALRNLTDHPADDGPTRGQVGRPAWSPDGERIAFVSYRDNEAGDVFVMDRDGRNVANLTNHPAADTAPSWSPDGTSLVFTSGRADPDPSISVDDQPLISQLFLMDADGGNVRRLTSSRRSDANPTWSPDGEQIAFQAWLVDDGGHLTTFDIFVIDADGMNEVNLTKYPGFSFDPDWAPDGSMIAFETQRSGDAGLDVYTMRPDGSNPVNLTRSRSFDAWPDWSPDGDRIAFTSRRDGNNEIYIMNADGSGQENITRHAADDRYPSWNPVR